MKSLLKATYSCLSRGSCSSATSRTGSYAQMASGYSSNVGEAWHSHIIYLPLKGDEAIMKILHLDSSILGPGSVTVQLTRLIVERVSGSAPADVVYRNLAADNLPHMTAATLPTAHHLSAMAGPLDENQ